MSETVTLSGPSWSNSTIKPRYTLIYGKLSNGENYLREFEWNEETGKWELMPEDRPRELPPGVWKIW